MPFGQVFPARHHTIASMVVVVGGGPSYSDWAPAPLG